MISEHISYEEAVVSPTATRLKIDNKPSEAILKNMITVANKCFEPLRKWYDRPIKVSSFYRSIPLNIAVGGALSSQHTKGEAIDMNAGSKAENALLFNWCKENLIYDQLIWEYGDDSGPTWVHISYSEGKNRKQIVVVK